MRHLYATLAMALMTLAPSTVWAQSEYGFKPVTLEQDFVDNGFSWFRHALLLAAGDREQSNAMAIGWGGIGTLWRKTAVTVYVAENRYTKQFMDRSQYFTVMAFSDRKDEIMEYMGTKILRRSRLCCGVPHDVCFALRSSILQKRGAAEDVHQLQCRVTHHVHWRSGGRLAEVTALSQCKSEAEESAEISGNVALAVRHAAVACRVVPT